MTDSTLFPELPPPPLAITRVRPRMSLEAVQVTAGADFQAIADWCDGEVGEQGGRAPDYGLHPAIRVFTGNGFAWATEGNWIVKASRFPMVYEATLFAEAYEQVTP